ncbi:dimethylsulfonioproprionate lyase family protein [Pacificoceanicola onchidii]|uniref:dimethylsulfonioproprionate lyase family protein n=1 Tax=Pacificoceanicola onchidii TaxID=2562685 RepID=UPI0010A6B00A|nr:dimethylsulfonioproprionate lyase family protein [Pacificoceanicola onchidii]
MTSAEAFEALWAQIRQVHAAEPALHGFGPLPPSPARQAMTPHHIPASAQFQAETGLYTEDHAALRDAAQAAAPFAQWRETYKGTALGQDFLDRFGCYAVAGGGGAFEAGETGVFLVYMPAGLDYPWHHHPAEEIYFVIAGEAEFRLHGEPPRTLRPGSHVFHPSNQPHATRTHAHPLLALVLWRGDLGTRPVLTPPEALT